jgi:hypothetical protein
LCAFIDAETGAMLPYLKIKRGRELIGAAYVDGVFQLMGVMDVNFGLGSPLSNFLITVGTKDKFS